MSYLTAINKARIAILTDNEEPSVVRVSVTLKHLLLREIGPMYAYRAEPEKEQLMGMKLEWTKAVPLTHPQISIRTAKGDTRIVALLDGDKP